MFGRLLWYSMHVYHCTWEYMIIFFHVFQFPDWIKCVIAKPLRWMCFYFFWCLSTCTFLTYIFSWVWTNATRQMHKNGNIDVLGDPENCKITIPTLPRKCHITKFTASPRLQDLTGRDIFYTRCTLPGTNWRLLCKLRHFNRGHGRGAQIVFQIDFDTTAFKN